MRKSKNRYFYQIFVSPGDSPRTITLNVIWMEREFDAYQYIMQHMLHCSLSWTSVRILTKTPALPQQIYKPASRGLSATAEFLVFYLGWTNTDFLPNSGF